MAKKPTRAKSGGEESSAPSGPEELPERWSAQRKTERVLRLLRGEPLDAVSRDSQVPAHGHFPRAPDTPTRRTEVSRRTPDQSIRDPGALVGFIAHWATPPFAHPNLCRSEAPSARSSR